MTKGDMTEAKGWTFAQVPIWVIGDPDISDGAVRLLGYLKYRQGTDAACWPSKATMAEDLHVSTDTISRRLTELTEAGYVNRLFRSGKTNLYQLIADPGGKAEWWEEHEEQRRKRKLGLETDPPAKMHPPANLQGGPSRKNAGGPSRKNAPHDDNHDDRKEQDTTSVRDENAQSLSEFEAYDFGAEYRERFPDNDVELSFPRGDEPWLLWGDDKVHALGGVEANDLRRVGWLIEQGTGMRPVDGEWSGWLKALVQVFNAAGGDFERVERGVELAWDREEKYRPGHPMGFVKAVRKVEVKPESTGPPNIHDLPPWWEGRDREETPEHGPWEGAAWLERKREIARRKEMQSDGESG